MVTRRDNIREGTPNCRDHCGGCGLHFSSLAAFDLHRVGSIQKGTRRCRAPEQAKTAKGVARLEVLTQTGKCTIATGPTQKNVTIWRTVDTSAK